MDITFLLDETELQSNRFVCCITDHNRYDLAIIDTKQFLGNSIVLSLQNGQMVLMCEEDIKDSPYWAPKLGIEEEDTKALQDFLYTALGSYEPAKSSY